MSRPRFSVLNIVIAIVGIGLLIYTVRNVEGGWPAIVEGIGKIGWWFLAVVFLGALRMAFRTRAWMLCANDPQLKFGDAFSTWLVSDAMGNITPLGLLASEPTKVLMTRTKISTVTSIASVTIENIFYTASVLAVLLSGTWLFLQLANVPQGLEQISELIISAVATIAVIGAWTTRARPALLSRFAPYVGAVVGRPDVPADAIREIEQQIYAVPRWPLLRIAHVFLWEVAFHIAAVAEVWIVLRLLVPDITVGEAFLLESAGRFVTVAFKFVPFRLGIDEAGSSAVATAVGLPSASGATLALVRRLRIIVLNAIGMIRLVR